MKVPILASIICVNFAFLTPKTKTLDIEPKPNLNLGNEILKMKIKIAIYCLYIASRIHNHLANHCKEHQDP